MKLAEALILRADCQRKITQIKQRLLRNAKIQEGEDTFESISHILSELNSVLNELTSLVKKINKTNNNTMFDEENTISDILAYRDQLANKRNILKSLIDEATVKFDRYTRHEVKFVVNIDIKNLQKEVDYLAKSYRELDIKIQEKNWTTSLIDD